MLLILWTYVAVVIRLLAPFSSPVYSTIVAHATSGAESLISCMLLHIVIRLLVITPS